MHCHYTKKKKGRRERGEKSTQLTTYDPNLHDWLSNSWRVVYLRHQILKYQFWQKLAHTHTHKKRPCKYSNTVMYISLFSRRTELRSCNKAEVAVLGSPSLTILMVSVDTKQHWTIKNDPCPSSINGTAYLQVKNSHIWYLFYKCWSRGQGQNSCDCTPHGTGSWGRCHGESPQRAHSLDLGPAQTWRTAVNNHRGLGWLVLLTTNWSTCSC